MTVRLFRRQALKAALALGALPRPAFADAAVDVEAEARWLAGVAPRAAAEHGDAASLDEWRSYARREDERWQLGSARLKAMQDWAAREIAPLLPADHALFYPFAGPDALHALALFGVARRIVLVGLEPVGALPDPTRPPPVGFFTRLGVALGDVHRLTFFRTQEMSTDFQREGVLAALVATIVRMGGKVASVHSSSGFGDSSQDPAGRGGASAPSAARSARIEWIATDGQARRLDYVQADLANVGLKGSAGFVATVRGLAPYVTFVKAAMYLLAETRFSDLRQMILDDSAVVVQDDTGIPFRHFDERWATRLFGRYEGPGAPYEDRVQPALRAAFERPGVSLLPFGIGYHVQSQRSNLLIASKGRR
jgi:hypothetical protein